ncbi:MAG: hypothetical protein KatS3mg126_1357 [Lysobacteraceae bacterium]|nr:MAG: hypothetical protein KatS3mg126_1357 [Xanthomonadaceae bacterium]
MNPKTGPWRSALRLGLLGLAVGLLLQGVRLLTAARIEAAREAQLRAALQLALPDADLDPTLGQEWVEVRAPGWLGSRAPMRVYRARRQGELAGWIVEAEAPDGYGGPIRMLVGIDGTGRVQGVRLTEHQETPGLGDYVDARRDDWWQSLRLRSLTDPPPPQWGIAADGGRFPYRAGATISPRAVVAAVARALGLVARHHHELASAPAGSLLELPDGP